MGYGLFLGGIDKGGASPGCVKVYTLIDKCRGFVTWEVFLES